MKTPTDPKEELLKKLAKSLLRDAFASACMAGLYSQPVPAGAQEKNATFAFMQADALLEQSYTPPLIDEISKLKP